MGEPVDKERELEQRLSNARTIMESARESISQTEEDIVRFGELEKAHNYIRVHGTHLHLTARFSASTCIGHEEAAKVTKDFLLGDDWLDVRRRLIEDIQREMLEIAERHV